MSSQLDYLDEIATRAAKGDVRAVGTLSTGERCYVALASNSAALLADDGNTIAEALARIGPDWVEQLIKRWQYRGNPANL
jgi:hypothetical protein